jgi:hypothetical protein
VPGETLAQRGDFGFGLLNIVLAEKALARNHSLLKALQAYGLGDRHEAYVSGVATGAPGRVMKTSVNLFQVPFDLVHDWYEVRVIARRCQKVPFSGP